MIIPPFKLLAVDSLSHNLLVIEGASGEILFEVPYPPALVPKGLAVFPAKDAAYLPATVNAEQGALLVLNLKTLSLYCLPAELPGIARFAITPSGDRAYITDSKERLYTFDPVTLQLRMAGQPESVATCTALAATDSELVSVWECGSGGIAAVFSYDGKLKYEVALPGLPTGLAVDSRRRFLVTFTANSFTGEGVVIYDLADPGGCLATITIQCSGHVRGLKAYPCHAEVSPDGNTAYIVNEDSCSLTVIDLSAARVIDCIAVGRSLSNLKLLPDPRFAIASSNAFADLALIDLVNGRMLSETNTPREILNFIAVLPHN